MQSDHGLGISVLGGSTGAPISVSGRGIDAWPAQFGLTGAVFC